MNKTQTPPSLMEAMATEPLWLQMWVSLLVIVHLAALLFVVRREREQGWQFRIEPLAIFASFVVAAAIMNWMYGQFGYVRLLGLAHLVGWTPVFVWMYMVRHRFPVATVLGKYLRLYLVIAGISLVIDAIDVIRYMLGDGQL